ncbi:NAD(P)H nitroreductase [Mycobacterium kansasii]|uniref:NAD(P)H nitroreductase n=1 Tax=Mycobacterium attenuatum TaxID=2341086 RepID=A0A498PWD3_9MYCO|nr:nitroreductase family protein [Mycobacterium attenuatum]ORB86070.1 NAD(P)H nitroreductase [Mycobacterium kansasii]VBA36573.1 Putative NAD(P)H nitroreductase [Mycobacterium attenuatum]VBA49131.1 Putative NAD(P)H nitroreductase [Mycobacterium attenuatum]VBA54650.1 Putative NAD(P)H nitroreductase [Mycobacterium attenuatum]
MDAQFPDASTLRAVLTLATRAPSVHNTQPWRWRVGTASVDLFSAPDRQLHSTDPDGRDLIISCGVVLHHCAVALASMGWHARVSRFPAPDDARHLATIKVQTQVPDQADIALAAAIPRRRTDRRVYSSWPVPGGDVAQMAARAARCGVMLRQVDALDKMRSIVTQAVWTHASDDGYIRELTTWSGRYGGMAGVPARNTPPSDRSAPIPGRLFAAPALAQPAGVAPADDGGVILALGTDNDDRVSRLRAGEATSAVLLTATAMGLASCPITEPLEIQSTRDAVRTDVFGDSGYPQMLLRVGWAPINADPLPATPRRSLAQVVDWPRELLEERG